MASVFLEAKILRYGKQAKRQACERLSSQINENTAPATPIETGVAGAVINPFLRLRDRYLLSYRKIYFRMKMKLNTYMSTVTFLPLPAARCSTV